ncbi:MAG: AAA family ATPase [Planctomycetota bacterium]
MRTITFFNNKGGVGKTTLAYHVAWMCAELGQGVLAVDLDPQANLTTMFLDEQHLETLWPEEGLNRSILSCILPIIDGVGDIADATLQQIRPGIHLLPGDLGLSQFEDKLSDNWPRCLDRDKGAFRVITAFHRIIHHAAERVGADIVLLDVGPNLGAINRAALIASDHVVMPLAPGLFSLQGLRNLGPTLRAWRDSWQERLNKKPPDLDIPMPAGIMRPAGYVVMQHVERKDRPVKAYLRWISKIPGVYQEYVLGKAVSVSNPDTDSNRIGLIKNYQSLMPLAEDARKPIFKLTPADGAIGAHAAAVSKCYGDFKDLTEEIIRRTDGC